MPNKDTNPDQKDQSGQQGQNNDRRIGQSDQPGSGGKLGDSKQKSGKNSQFDPADHWGRE